MSFIAADKMAIFHAMHIFVIKLRCMSNQIVSASVGNRYCWTQGRHKNSLPGNKFEYAISMLG